MDAEVDVVAGILLADSDGRDRAGLIDGAADALAAALTPSSVWERGIITPSLEGLPAYGQKLPIWRPVTDLTARQEDQVAEAWNHVLPSLDRSSGARRLLRVRVDAPEHVRHLRGIGAVDGLHIVPSLESRGSRRPFVWRWPLRVGVVSEPGTGTWLETVRSSPHHGVVFDAEEWWPEGDFDIAIVGEAALGTALQGDRWRLREVPCVIVAGSGSADDLLIGLEKSIAPSIGVAFTRPPGAWWSTLFEEMAHDLPLDAAVESVVARGLTEGLVAGPRFGLDVTASGRWLAAAAAHSPRIDGRFGDVMSWSWDSEGEGARRSAGLVREVRSLGEDPRVSVPWVQPASRGPGVEAGVPGRLPGREAAAERPAEQAADDGRPTAPRRLVARVYDGGAVVATVLPPHKKLDFAVRIAIPQEGDIAADEAAPDLPASAGPVVQLEVVVRGDVWQTPPAPQPISIAREKLAMPSTWARFSFTTPAENGLVSIEIIVLYQGKPLQAATYVSPVRTEALPDELPTLTTFALTGPDEPTDDLRPVQASLDGRSSELYRTTGGDARVSIADAKEKLAVIEERVSRVLGQPNAPASFDDERVLGLLVTLARLGSELRRQLRPLSIEDATSIDVSVDPETTVFPLELVYEGAPPAKQGAKLCHHVDAPPPLGEGCAETSSAIVCPYAFWGLHRTISRTVFCPGGRSTAPATRSGPDSVLYAATSIADADVAAGEPKPTETVLAAAKANFHSVAQAESWTVWAEKVKSGRPRMLVVLGHTLTEGGEQTLYIGEDSRIARPDISDEHVHALGSPPPVVLLIACASAGQGDPFGNLPGALASHGAGAVVGTLSRIVGPQGAEAAVHLLDAFHSRDGGSIGDAVAHARRTLVAHRRPLGLLLVSHGELDTKLTV